MLAPIVLFVYNRPELTLQTLRALKEAEHSQESTLYIFSDGPKEKNDPAALQKINAVREIIRQEQWCKEVIIRESEQNKGLADSVISGVTEVVSKHERVIVLEDDIIVSRGFLTYMNQALDLYAKEDHVAGVSGFCFYSQENFPSTFLLPIGSSWGWGTWNRQWSKLNFNTDVLFDSIISKNLSTSFDFGSFPYSQMLKDQKSTKVDSWAIRFYANFFLEKKSFIFPKASLVTNMGFGNESTHTRSSDSPFENYFDPIGQIHVVPNMSLNNEVISKTQAKFESLFAQPKREEKKKRKDNSMKGIIVRVLKKLLRLFEDNKTPIKPVNSNKKYRISDAFKLSPEDRIKVGKDSILECSFHFDSASGGVHIGSRTFIGNSSLISIDSITIGDDVLISWGCTIIDNNSHAIAFSNRKNDVLDWNKSTENKGAFKDWTNVKRSPITIKNKAWVGFNSIILKGVTIGEGSIVAAGSVVTKDVPDWTIVGGNPAQIIKHIPENER